METSPTTPLTREKLLTERNRVVSLQSPVFLRLSLLFLLPDLSIATVLLPLSIAPVLFQTLKPIIFPEESNPSDETASFSKNDILLALGTYLVVIIFSISAIASITFTAFHGFNDEPIKLKAAIKSISASFFPVLATLLLSQVIIFMVTFLFFLVVILFLGALAQLGFANFTASKFFIALVFAVIFISILMYFQVNWLLAYSVVVVESKWGFEALKRSAALINGNKWIAFRVIVKYGVMYLLFFFNITGPIIFGTSSSALLILFFMLSLIMIQLYSVVEPTVLYALCKESQTDEYFSLPVNDQKIAYVV